MAEAICECFAPTEKRSSGACPPTGPLVDPQSRLKHERTAERVMPPPLITSYNRETPPPAARLGDKHLALCGRSAQSQNTFHQTTDCCWKERELPRLGCDWRTTNGPVGGQAPELRMQAPFLPSRGTSPRTTSGPTCPYGCWGPLTHLAFTCNALDVRRV